MKYLITTRADEGVQDYADISHPIIKRYADLIGADFLVMDHESGCTEGNGKWHYRILKHKELHEEYDRIMHLDTDMLLVPGCPNIFDVVAHNNIGTTLEDRGSRRGDRKSRIFAAQQQFGDVGWKDQYINTGVFVTSKCHAEIYQTINDGYWLGYGQDDVHLGYLIKKNNFTIQDLGHRFNHMTMFSEPWNGSPDRFDSHIIHYAGAGVFEPGPTNGLEQMKRDYKKLYE
jgi:hypothetical protein